MSDLPSRDRAHSVLTESEVKEIVEAWRSGGLVDHEAIDYEDLPSRYFRLGPTFIFDDSPPLRRLKRLGLIEEVEPGRLVDRDAIDPLIESIRTWSKAYPVEVFPPPPKGEHAATIDGCHAHAGRHIIGRLMELIPDGGDR